MLEQRGLVKIHGIDHANPNKRERGIRVEMLIESATGTSGVRGTRGVSGTPHVPTIDLNIK